LGTGVPWVMCKQDDAPDPVVSHLKFFAALLIISIICYTISGE